MFRIALTLFTLLFLAAHGLRTGSTGISMFWLAAAALALSPHPWKSGVVALLLGYGVWMWGDICLELVHLRIAHNLPWKRLAIILGTVSGVTFLAAVLNLRQADSAGWKKNLPMTVTFFLVVLTLLFIREKAPYAMLLPDRFFAGGGYLLAILLGWYGAVVCEKMLDPSESAKWRLRVWTLFSTLFFLQLILGLAGWQSFLMTGKLHLPVPALIAAGPLYRGEGLFMIVLFATTLILVGPAWCSHLCYIGAWDNLASRAQRNSGPLAYWTSYMRWIILLLVLASAFALGRSGVPVIVALSLAAVFGLVGVGIMLVWSRKKGVMTHCVAYCPMGVIANIFGRVNPWRVRIDKGCNSCGFCSRFCKYDALTPVDIARRRSGLTCTLCGDCITSCKDSRLHYSFPGLSRKNARMSFIVMVVSLHAIFLGVARL